MWCWMDGCGTGQLRWVCGGGGQRKRLLGVAISEAEQGREKEGDACVGEGETRESVSTFFAVLNEVLCWHFAYLSNSKLDGEVKTKFSSQMIKKGLKI